MLRTCISSRFPGADDASGLGKPNLEKHSSKSSSSEEASGGEFFGGNHPSLRPGGEGAGGGAAGKGSWKMTQVSRKPKDIVPFVCKSVSAIPVQV